MSRPFDPDLSATEALERLHARRKLIQWAAAGTTFSLLGGGLYGLSDVLSSEARAATRSDGRPRLPPGQRVLEKLKPMGGDPGDARPSAFRLRVHGAVERPLTLTLAELVQMSSVTLPLDVHCVTGWSVLGAKFKGVPLARLAEKVGVSSTARHVIFEAAHGYTANMSLKDALHPRALIAWELDGQRLARAHGAPVRAVNPDSYFWKSPKWLTGIRFAEKDEPGYWEVRGYHNHADPWKEERHA